jgi:hypothetical protein
MKRLQTGRGKLPAVPASDGITCAEHMEGGKEGWDAGDQQTESQQSNHSPYNTCKHEPPAIQVRFRLASLLKADDRLSRGMLGVHRSAPVQGVWLYCNTKKIRTTDRSF